MDEAPLREILNQYTLGPVLSIKTISSGLINKTYEIVAETGEYILQSVNSSVFSRPDFIDNNIRAVSAFFNKHYPAIPFAHLVPNRQGTTLINIDSTHFYRLFDKIPDSITLQVIQDESQAYQAAWQFAAFARRLNGFPLSDLKITIPDFHNLSLRYSQFQKAAESGNAARISHSKVEIAFLTSHTAIVHRYEQLLHEQLLPLRVIHHDTKISNVLFDANFRGICPIDLDTVMPGYVISDVGDMMRTYLCPVDENTRDLSKVIVRQAIYQAILDGYTDGWMGALTTSEIELLPFSGSFIIYMQALRFLTDYLLDDCYYGATYPEQNMDRCKNQIKLLQEYLSMIAG